MISGSYEALNIVACEARYMRKAGARLGVAQAQLTILVQTTCIQITHSCLNDGMMSSRRYALDTDAIKVGDYCRYFLVVGRLMAELTLTTEAKGVKSAITGQHKRVLSSGRNINNGSIFGGKLLQSVVDLTQQLLHQHILLISFILNLG